MNLVQITGNVQTFDHVLRRCSATGMFHPELATEGGATAYRPASTENPYKKQLSKVIDIGEASGLSLKYDPEYRSDFHTEDIEGYLQGMEETLGSLSEERMAYTADIDRYDAALQQLVHMDALDVSFDDIFACRYLQVRFGRLPTESFNKLNYYAQRQFECVSLSGDGDYHWCVYFTTHDHKAEIDEIFASLYFERIHIPEYVHGKPGDARVYMEGELRKAREGLAGVTKQLDAFGRKNKALLDEIYSRLRFISEAFDLRKYVTMYDKLFEQIEFVPARITGFVTARNAAKFAAAFDDMENVVVDIRPPDSDNRFTVPTKLRNNRFVKPFQMFVEMYGTPRYNEADPTPFLAITYTLLFGIMFGDVGQGAVIALLGFALWKLKKMTFGRILMRIGVSAACFGLVYGSVFGLEHLLDPMYKALGFAGKPVEIMEAATINELLVVAVAIGVLFILQSLFFNVYIGIRNRDWERSLFGNNGVAGIVFYVSVLAGAVSMLTGGKNLFTPLYVTFLIVLPILVIFLKEPLGHLAAGGRHIKPEGGIGSFVLEGFFELFEVVLSFITNTMSFLRVGGFIISHAGMMAVVMTLTEMMAGSGSILVLILGNAFVMALEGFIVGIQALRLEFYELFSHYFDGQGKQFAPIVIGKEHSSE